jgi:hypothetical protein
MSNEREKHLEELLAKFLKPIRGIPFEVVIRSLCDVGVMRFDLSQPQNSAALGLIVQAMGDACRTVRSSPIRRPRPNEVGNDMEPFVVAALNARGLKAAAPRTRNGLGKSTGYPDIRIDTEGLPIFLEVKTYAAANHATTQRSFYLSPADDPKVFEDAHHLLVGFEIARDGDLYSPVGFEVVDLFGLECDMKSEFNSDNRRLYAADRLLARERIDHAM